MGVAKAALEATARYLARDLGPRGVRVNLVAAGPLGTVAARGIPGFEELAEMWSRQAPIGWDGEDAGPVADAVLFLLSDLARGDHRRDHARRRRLPRDGRADDRGTRGARRRGSAMTQRPFRRLAIVNRGEAAMRAIRAVRELNWERDDPIRIIALHIEAERHALFVRQADERHCLGEGGYLDYDELERALTETRADAAWVGWGFVAEHPEFAELCERLGIVFVGPDADVMRALGDKVEGKRLAEKADVPRRRLERRRGRDRRRGQRSRRHDRLPADDQGGGRRRRPRDAPCR